MSSTSSPSSLFSLGSVVLDSSGDAPMGDGDLTMREVQQASRTVGPQPHLLRAWHWVHLQQLGHPVSSSHREHRVSTRAQVFEEAITFVQTVKQRLDSEKYSEFLRMLREITCKNCLFFNVAELFRYENDLLAEFIKYLR